MNEGQLQLDDTTSQLSADPDDDDDDDALNMGIASLIRWPRDSVHCLLCAHSHISSRTSRNVLSGSLRQRYSLPNNNSAATFI